MKVLQVTGAYPPLIGGGSTFVRDLTNHLRKRGHDVHVVTTDSHPESSDDHPSVHRANALTIAGAPVAPSFAGLYWRVLREFQPDVVHSYYPLPFYPDVAGSLAARADVPFVFTAFGAWEMNLRSIIGLLGIGYNRTALRYTLRRATVHHTLSPAVLTDIDVYSGYEDRFEVIPQGVDVARFDPEKVDSPPPFDTTAAAFTILFVGVFRRYKGLPTLIAALDSLRVDHGLDVRLALVGDGPKRQAVETAVADYGLADQVDFLGQVSEDALLAAYKHADVFVLPSPSIKESFGAVTLEALSMGTPVVATTGSGSGAYLSTRDVGTTVEPHDSGALAEGIASLLTDDRRYAEEKAQSRPFAREHLSWEALIEDYERLYENAVRML